MTREAYAPWGEGVGDGEFARAFAALGLAASHAPELLAGEPDAVRITDRLRAALGEPDPSAALTWRDPVLSAEWDAAGAAPTATWAAAWGALDLDPPVRLALDADPASAGWLTATLSVPGGPAATAFVSLGGAGTPPPWRFPLRIGFLDEPAGRALRDELVAGFARSSWQRTLIDPVVLGRERVTCDLLVLTDSPADALEAVAGARELRAGAVLGVRALDPWDGALVAALADLTGAWAVGFCEIPDPARWLPGLTQHLSHNLPLDEAFALSTVGWGGVIAARPEVVGTQRAARLAEAMADAVRHVDRIDIDRIDPAREVAAEPLDPPLAASFDNIAATGAFVSESGEATALVELGRQATPLIERAAAARWLQARMTVSGRPKVPMDWFRAGAMHRIAVHIGPRAEGSLVATTPFPTDRLPTSGPYPLTVVLAEPTLLRRPLVRRIVLPMVGASTVARFTLRTRPDTTVVDARIIVLSGNRVLQTARLPSAVEGAVPPEPPATAATADAARPETFVAPATEHLADRRSFDAAFVVNTGADGASRATAVAGGAAAVVRLDGETIKGAVAKITEELAGIAQAPEAFAALESEDSVALLRFLAFHGAQLRQALVHDTPGLAAMLAGSRYIQVVSAKPDAYFPFEFAYDLPAPNPDARLCRAARAALAAEDVAAGCPGRHSARTVCPFGFWALTRVIERHAFQAADEVTGDFMLRGRPARDRGRIPLGAVVFAASNRVDQVDAGSTAKVVTALDAAAGGHDRVSTWPRWRTAIAGRPGREPGLLLLLPHTVFVDAFRSFGLEIGRKAQLAAISAEYVPDQRPVLVTLLGCETARPGEISYERFPSLFRLAGAEVVIATLTEVLGRHAAPVAARLVEELYRYCAIEPHGLGEVMVRLRRKLLADGLIMVLVLTAFGDADWLIIKGEP